MLTIAGTGVNNYSIEKLANQLDFNFFDHIIMDTNYYKNKNNKSFWENESKLITGSFSLIRSFILETLKNNRNATLLYLVSGNPNFYSGGTVIIKYLQKELDNFNPYKEVVIIKNESSKDYLIKKLMIPENEIDVQSLHGKFTFDLNRFLIKKYTFLLTDASSLYQLKNNLQFLDQNDFNIILGSHLGYKKSELILSIINLELFLKKYDQESLQPCVILIEKRFYENQSIVHDQDLLYDEGMITKEDKRGLILSALELHSNLLLWDIGAGSGSVGISAFCSYRVRTLYFEKNRERINNIKENLKRFKVFCSRVVEGDANQLIKDEKESPDRIFIGGGGEKLATQIPYLYNKLNERGIIVIHYVSMNSLIKGISILKEHNIPFTIKSITLTSFRDDQLMLSEPERLLFQLKIVK